MRLIPVLDLLAGQVVRGVGGRRHEYRPIQSCLTKSCEPVEGARGLQKKFGFNELYVADLDAIAGQPPALETYAALQELGLHLWIDAGIREVGMAQQLAAAEVHAIVLGLETIPGPDELADIGRRLGWKRVIFS